MLRHQASFSRYQATVCSSPSAKVVRARQPGESGHLVRRADVAVDLSEPLRDVHLRRLRLADALEHEIGDVGHRDVDARGDVDDLARELVDRRLDQRLDRLGVVVDVEPVAARVPVAVNRQRRRRRAPA